MNVWWGEMVRIDGLVFWLESRFWAWRGRRASYCNGVMKRKMMREATAAGMPWSYVFDMAMANESQLHRFTWCRDEIGQLLNDLYYCVPWSHTR